MEPNFYSGHSDSASAEPSLCAQTPFRAERTK